MEYRKPVHFKRENGNIVTINGAKNIPDKCPFCKNNTNFALLEPGFEISPLDINKLLIAIVMKCSCGAASMGYFRFTHELEPLACLSTYPVTVATATFSKGIASLSPKFVEIYNQALHAENIGLHEICGTGYRKALEFLVKDFLIKQDENKAEPITKELLSASINRLEDKKLKTVASRTAWLGNDETHYVRKHTDKDLKDLKLLLSATVSYIDTMLIIEIAENIPKAN